MRLPAIPRAVGKYETEPVALRGLNYSDSLADGDLTDCENLSARRWPWIATRNARAQLPEYENVTALGAWEALVAVSGTDLLYDGERVGTVSAGEKQFAVVNTKLVIWPDKKYLDMTTRQLRPLAAEAGGVDAVFTEDGLTVSGWDADFTTLFQAGDVLHLSGCVNLPGNNKSFRVTGVAAGALTAAAGTFAAGNEYGRLTLARKIPALDFICESENRLWGCSNAERAIYASALGDPTNFYTFEGLSTDSYAATVGSEGDFTGCCRLSGAVLFWKERTLHKVLGSYPAQYELSAQTLEGVQAGCSKSMCIVNDVLYYKGEHGVYAYNGGTPAFLSAAFGNRDFRDCVAGSDGIRYYLSVREGREYSLLVYDLRHGVWLREDDTRCRDFARLGASLYFCDSGGKVWLADSGQEDPDISWNAFFAPMYETIAGRKRYRKLRLRLLVPEDGEANAICRFGHNGVWKPLGSVAAAGRDVTTLQIPIARADSVELRLNGIGPCAVLGMNRTFSVGSDR